MANLKLTLITTKTDVILIGSMKKLTTPSKSVNLSVDNIPVNQESTVPWNTQQFIVIHLKGQNNSED